MVDDDNNELELVAEEEVTMTETVGLLKVDPTKLMEEEELELVDVNVDGVDVTTEVDDEVDATSRAPLTALYTGA